jgi:hypothetical protein
LSNHDKSFTAKVAKAAKEQSLIAKDAEDAKEDSTD